MNKITDLLFGKDPITSLLGYASGGLTAWITSRIPGLTESSTLQEVVSVIVFLLYALWGRQTNESKSATEPAKGGE